MSASRVLAGIAMLTVLGACAAPADETTSSSSPKADACAKDQLALKTKGKLTIGTDKPAYPPWVVDDDPALGKGYEAALAYEIATTMGFTKDEVVWVVAPFDSVIQPGAKSFDFDLNQVSITEDRKKAVDFSSGYYDVRQTVVSYKGSPIDGVTSVAELAKAKLGAMVGTTSLTALRDQIKPAGTPMVYNTNDLAVTALKNKDVDGLVVDLPTAFYMTGAQLDDGVIVGQLPAGGGTPEQFGAVLDKGSALTPCVTKAVDALRADGSLDALVKEWLSTQGAPELK